MFDTLGTSRLFHLFQPDNISGVAAEHRPGLYEEFRERLVTEEPELLASIEAKEKERLKRLESLRNSDDFSFSF